MDWDFLWVTTGFMTESRGGPGLVPHVINYGSILVGQSPAGFLPRTRINSDAPYAQPTTMGHPFTLL